MRKKKYLYDFVIQILLIGAVIMLFQKSPNKIQASFWASALFVMMPLSMMSREWILFRFSNKVWWGAVLQFWLLFAIPIMTMRILHPRVSLSEVTLGGVPINLWHQLSNISFLFLMSATLWSWWYYRQKEKSSGK